VLGKKKKKERKKEKKKHTFAHFGWMLTHFSASSRANV